MACVTRGACGIRYNRIPNKKLHSLSSNTHVWERATKLKWKWGGHVARFIQKDGRTQLQCGIRIWGGEAEGDQDADGQTY